MKNSEIMATGILIYTTGGEYLHYPFDGYDFRDVELEEFVGDNYKYVSFQENTYEHRGYYFSGMIVQENAEKNGCEVNEKATGLLKKLGAPIDFPVYGNILLYYQP